MRDYAQRFLKWESVVAICYFVVLLFELKVIFPTTQLSGYFLFESYGGVISIPLIIDAAIGASCAPIAYLAVIWAYRKLPDFRFTLMNWRMVLLIGAVASLFNSAMRATLLGGTKTFSEIYEQAASVLIGDMTGLLVGI